MRLRSSSSSLCSAEGCHVCVTQNWTSAYRQQHQCTGIPGVYAFANGQEHCTVKHSFSCLPAANADRHCLCSASSIQVNIDWSFLFYLSFLSSLFFFFGNHPVRLCPNVSVSVSGNPVQAGHFLRLMTHGPRYRQASRQANDPLSAFGILLRICSRPIYFHHRLAVDPLVTRPMVSDATHVP